MDKYFQKLSQYFSISPADEVDAHRVKVALEVGGIAVALIGFGWAVFFLFRGAWVIALIELLLMLAGLSALVMLKRNRIMKAVFLLLSAIYGILLGMSLFLDVPSADTPRVVHIYFLVCAFYSYLLLVNQHKWFRRAALIFLLANFVLFSGTNFSIGSVYVIPENVRLAGAWVNSAIAISLLCVILYIMQSNFVVSSQVGSELGKAVWENQFELYYQPQVEGNGEVFGAEALIRWNHPVRGVVSPMEFIPIAEKLGLMIPIGYWVLNQACLQLEIWSKKPETAHLTVSVNVSAQQFSDPDFVSKVLLKINSSGIQAGLLKLELTESILMNNVEDVIVSMTMLKAAGVGISLDDFGTGYSSLSYLKRLPLDQLKIDKSFVRDILDDSHDLAIARTIISLGRDLGLKVIAEGVESERQQHFLLENGCSAFQGYWFSHPLPIEQFEDYIGHVHH